MEPYIADEDWKACPQVTVDPEVVHGTPVFAGTRMPVEDAVQFYHYYRSEMGMSDEQAVNTLLKEYRSIPGADALRAVISYESALLSKMQPS